MPLALLPHHTVRALGPDDRDAVIDDWQGRRLGTRLAIQTIQRAKLNGFSLLTGTTFWDNRAARRMMPTLGFNTVGYDGALLDMELRLT